MYIETGWAYNGIVRLHYLDNRSVAAPSLTPIVFIPGRFGTAEDYVVTEFAGSAPRRCIAVSLRGRGNSDTPPQGYTLEDHVADVSALLIHLRLDRFCLMGYSLGVPYVLAQAVQHPLGLRGVILGDYPARYSALPHDWTESVLAAHPGRVKPEVARGLQRDSKLLLWDTLQVIDVPVLVLRGALPGALLSAEAADMYRQKLSHVRVVILENSAHELWGPEYIEALREFLGMLEGGQASTA